jgi:hypothetical protein
MESFIPVFRLMHFLGLALLFGGTLCSIVLSKKEDFSKETVKNSWNCMHLVAAPGLILLFLTGILQSSAAYWSHFKGAGYMHVKVALALLVLGFMVFDMRTQKRILRSSPSGEVMMGLLKTRQFFAVGICGLTLLIMLLVSYRPF